MKFIEKRKAALKRFWHCLSKLHRQVDAGKATSILGFTFWVDKQYIGCECGKKFYTTPEGEELMQLIESMAKHSEK